MINPSVKDFLERHENLTLIGFAWSIFWRMAILFWFGSLVVGLLGDSLL